MFDEKKRIKSKLLEGITKEDEGHSGNVLMQSTGNIVQIFDDETDPGSWTAEFKSEASNELILAWYADINDLIRDALKENGIIKDQ